jgi:Tfp pilus assembly protein PilP
MSRRNNALNFILNFILNVIFNFIFNFIFSFIFIVVSVPVVAGTKQHKSTIVKPAGKINHVLNSNVTEPSNDVGILDIPAAIPRPTSVLNAGQKRTEGNDIPSLSKAASETPTGTMKGPPGRATKIRPVAQIASSKSVPILPPKVRDAGTGSKNIRELHSKQIFENRMVSPPTKKLALTETVNQVSAAGDLKNEAKPAEAKLDGEPKESTDANRVVASEVSNGQTIDSITMHEQEYHYTSLSKDDPFLAPIFVDAPIVEATPEPVAGKKPPDAEEIPIVSPLQYYDVKELVATGIWVGRDGKFKAMIETPDQQGIPTKIHDPVGKNGGRIIDITNTGVIVREYRILQDGSQDYSDRIIGMSKDTATPDKGILKPGGVIILKPGASKAEVRLPEEDAAIAPFPIPPSGSPLGSASGLAPVPLNGEKLKATDIQNKVEESAAGVLQKKVQEGTTEFKQNETSKDGKTVGGDP